MHERKWAMAELSDGFLCLPGGPGTFEEIFEQWTWALLGFHAKPCGFVNVNGYYEPMRASIQNMSDHGFLAQQYVDMDARRAKAELAAGGSADGPGAADHDATGDPDLPDPSVN